MTVGDIAILSRFLVDADSTSYTNANLLININNSYERVIGNIIAENTNIIIGDSRFTTLPTGLANLVAGTQSYRLTTLDANWLTVHTVKVLDSSSDWVELDLINLKDVEPFEQYQETDGLPLEYAVREDFIMLFPAPAAAKVTTTNGLQVVFERTASVFTSAELTTGTVIPGFASPYHELLSFEAAIPYAIKYKPERVQFLRTRSKEIEKDLMRFYARRDKDTFKRPVITSKIIEHR